MKRKNLLIVGFILFLMVSCETAEPTDEALLTPTLVEVEANTFTPSSTKTSTHTPEPTVTATRTPRPPTATRTPSPTIPAATATFISLVESIESPCINEKDWGDSYGWNNFSPDEKWIVIQCESSEFGSYTDIVSVDNNQSWQIFPRETYIPRDEWHWLLSFPFHWSGEGRYLYISIGIGDQDGPGLIFVNGVALRRLDLETGQISETFTPSDFRAAAMSISPNSRYLAYTNPALDSNVHIQNFQTGEEITYQLEEYFENIGLFTWSDDSKKLAFSATDSKFNSGDYSSGMSLYVLDQETGMVTLLINSPPKLYFAKKWLSSDEILFSALWEEEQDFIFDLATMTFSPAP